MEEKQTPKVVTSVWQYSFAEDVSRRYVQEHQPPELAKNLATWEQRLLNAGRLSWDNRGPHR